MSLSSMAEEIKDHVEQGQAWLAKVVEEKLPALAAEAQKIQASPIFQALEGVVLPPEVEQEIANVVKMFVKLVPQQTATPLVPVFPAATAEPTAATVTPEPVPADDSGQADQTDQTDQTDQAAAIEPSAM